MSTSLYSGRSSYGGGVPSSRSYGIGDYGGSSYRSARDSSLGRNYTNYSSSYSAASPVMQGEREIEKFFKIYSELILILF